MRLKDKEFYVGKRYGDLSAEERRALLCCAAVDGRTCSSPKGNCDCIIDLPNGLSVPGYLQVGEDYDTISIEDDAVLYDPSA